ncbi:Rossmann-like and DUF2520 domain-containing protein [Arundinibacter roseus]|uniref:DUF2520 domain-containing protein n=1 Tax=Arundinibacter roseus TaxID=2070510 RepID=A0A4R4K8J5_9BACT|nr:Rossmann-like and DUF2520 domain-containing protein [Arundinibacter roseus]TDB63753.1 DUF2520 domain-containing protein [Arundinibacter roseus]
MKISFIGAGNVAWHLAQAFETAGHIICEIYSRDTQKARQLVSELYDARIQPDLNFAESEADMLIVAASDDALESIMQRVVLPKDAMLINTSGSRSLAELQHLVEIYSDVPVRTGVLYPLMTFTREVPLDYSQIPFFVEAIDDETEDILLKLARSVSLQVQRGDSEERRNLHVAAVFACNFTNHLLSIAHDLLEHETLSFQLLKPLIEQTMQKALLTDDPATVQTGPARRFDWDITSHHLDYLQELKPEWASIYRLLTEDIRERHFEPN